jgi:hypothetical protein
VDGRVVSKLVHPTLITLDTVGYRGYAVAQLVDALCYKPEDRGFDSPDGVLEFFIDTIFPAAL